MVVRSSGGTGQHRLLVLRTRVGTVKIYLLPFSYNLTSTESDHHLRLPIAGTWAWLVVMNCKKTFGGAKVI
jgi:hypothetical protein